MLSDNKLSDKIMLYNDVYNICYQIKFYQITCYQIKCSQITIYQSIYCTVLYISNLRHQISSWYQTTGYLITCYPIT
jgi:hypothetical protein